MKNLALRWGLVLSLLLTLVTVSAGAAGETASTTMPTAPTCSHTSAAEHGNWEEFTSSTTTLEAGKNYYLTGPVTLTAQVTVTASITKNDGAASTQAKTVLCLNGQTITSTGAHNDFFLNPGASFVLCDCQKSGTITHTGGGTGNVAVFYVKPGADLDVFDVKVANSNVPRVIRSEQSTDANLTNNGMTAPFDRTVMNLVNVQVTDHTTGTAGPILYAAHYTTLNLHNCTVKNVTSSNASPSYGLAIGADHYATVNMKDTTVSNAKSTSSAVYGAVGVSASYSGNSSTAINMFDGCVIENNVDGGSGGGVHISNDAIFNMYGGTIRNNGAHGKNGSGVFVGTGTTAKGTFNMYGGTISGNVGMRGAGVHVSAGTFNMKGGTITGNISTNSMGGGVYVNAAATFNMYNGATISNNKGIGGGVHLIEGGATFNMYGGEIKGNTGCTKKDNDPTGDDVANAGGGVFVKKGSTFTMSGGTISGNTAASGGGGVFMSGDATTKFIMTGGTISGNIAGTGGAVDIEAGTFEMDGENAVISNHTDVTKGTVYVAYSTSIFNLKNGTISENGNANNAGTVVYVNNGKFTMTGGNIKDNTGRNGIVYSAGQANAEVNFNGGTISGNEGVFGGVFFANAGTYNIDGATITGNSAPEGGAFYVNGCTINMKSGTLANNIATKTGGAVQVNAGTFNMTGGTMSGNEAPSGGAVYVSGGAFTMNNGTMSGNEALSGGAVYVSGGAFTMNNGTIENNASVKEVVDGETTKWTGSAGGGVYVKGGTFTMDGGTITGNHGQNGGGIYTEATVTINDGSIVGNTHHQNFGHEIAVFANGTVTVEGGTIGQNNKGASIGLHAGKAATGVYTPTITVNGGTIGGAFNHSVTSTAQGTGAKVYVILNGGLYSKAYTNLNPATDVEYTIAEGKAFKAADSMYVLAAKSNGTNMKLGESLNAMFHIPVAGTAATKVSATIDGVEANASFEVVGDEYVVTVSGVAASQMTKDISIVLKDADDNIVNAETDSIREYGMRILDDPEMSNAHAVVADMLHYGAAAQKYFSKTAVAEEDLADYGVTVTGADGAALLEAQATNSDLSYASSRAYHSANLTLDDQVDFNLYFWVGRISEEDKTYTYTINGKPGSGTFEDMLDDELLYQVKIPDLTIADLANCKVSFTFTESDGVERTITDSVFNYLVRNNNKSKWEEEGTDASGLAPALMAFAASSNEYAGDPEQGENELPIG